MNTKNRIGEMPIAMEAGKADQTRTHAKVEDAPKGEMPPENGREEPPKEPSAEVLAFRKAKAAAEEAYLKVPPAWRIREAGGWTRLSYLICAVGFISWKGVSPSGWRAVDLFVSPAYAQNRSVSLETVNILVLLVLIATFAVCLWVTLFSHNRRALDTANTLVKTLAGFFIGAATKFLGP